MIWSLFQLLFGFNWEFRSPSAISIQEQVLVNFQIYFLPYQTLKYFMQQSAKNLSHHQPLRKTSRIDQNVTSKRIVKRLIEQRLNSATATGKLNNGAVAKILSGTANNPTKRRSESQSSSGIVVRNSKRPENMDKIKHFRTNSLKNLVKPVDTAFERQFLIIKDELKAQMRASKAEPSKAQYDQHLRLVKQYSIDESKISKKPVESVRAYGANTHQGIVRNYNEDRVSIVTHFGLEKDSSFFAVYDGHGGSACADYLRDNMHKLLAQQNNLVTDPKQALRAAVLKAEQTVLRDSQQNNDFSGSCLLVALVRGEKIYFANVGDCRAIISEDNSSQVIQVTNDHKPSDPAEQQRIIKAGGTIYQNKPLIETLINPHRVIPGRLSVSRTIGDLEAKDPKYGGNRDVVIAEPELHEYTINEKSDFLILASDGIYDKLQNKQICQFVQKCKNYLPITQEVHSTVGRCIETIFIESFKKQSTDNLSIVMIAFSGFEKGKEKKSKTKILKELFKDKEQIKDSSRHSSPQKKPLTSRTQRTVSNLVSYKRLQTVKQVLSRKK